MARSTSCTLARQRVLGQIARPKSSFSAGSCAQRVTPELNQLAVGTRKSPGVAAADFSRIRNGDLSRFTIDRLINTLGKLDQRVDVQVTVRRREATMSLHDLGTPMV